MSSLDVEAGLPSGPSVAISPRDFHPRDPLAAAGQNFAEAADAGVTLHEPFVLK